MTASLPNRLSASFPAPQTWQWLLHGLLLLALAPLLLMVFELDGTQELARRGVVMHAGIAAVLLPIALLGQLNAGLRRAPGRVDQLLWLLIAGAGIAIPALVLLGLGKPMLLSYFPLLTHPAYPTLLIAVVLGAVLQALIRPGTETPSAARAVVAPGLGWLALPLLIALVVLAWAWTGSAATAPHIREELVAWGVGHAWSFVLASLAVWGWLAMGEVGGQPQTRWSLAAALAATGCLVVLTTTAIDSTDYLRRLTLFQLAAVWPVPAALAGSLLRDPIRRAVGGPILLASIAVFFLAVGAAAWLILTDTTATLRYGPLVLQHGLGLAALIALWGAIRHRRQLAPATVPVAPAGQRFGGRQLTGLAVLLVAAGLVIVLALKGPPTAGKKAPPIDPTTRQHAVASRQAEIQTRFTQGVQMMQLRQYDFAIKAFHRILELDPTIPEVHVNIGFALLETGDPAGAQRFFESASRLNKDQLNAYYGLALAATAQGAHAVAAGAMRTWLHLAPADDPFRLRAEAIFDQAVEKSRQQREGPAPG